MDNEKLYKEAINRLGEFGKLFVSYKGDPRGPTGRAANMSLKDEVLFMRVVTDVDGGQWRPVNEEALQEFIRSYEQVIAQLKASEAENKSREEASFQEHAETHYWRDMARDAERKLDLAIDQLRGDCTKCAHFVVIWNGCTPDYECPLSEVCLNRDNWEWNGGIA